MSAAWSLAPERVHSTGLCSGAGVDAVRLSAPSTGLLVVSGVHG
jgi:hypothetical protein